MFFLAVGALPLVTLLEDFSVVAVNFRTAYLLIFSLISTAVAFSASCLKEIIFGEFQNKFSSPILRKAAVFCGFRNSITLQHDYP